VSKVSITLSSLNHTKYLLDADKNALAGLAGQ
jgi:hypothetical protein